MLAVQVAGRRLLEPMEVGFRVAVGLTLNSRSCEFVGCTIADGRCKRSEMHEWPLHSMFCVVLES